jgi:hypothetical protein
MDEDQRYLSLSPVEHVKDLRNWWLEPTQQKHFPNLSKMAIYLLSVLAMSADAERVFSGTKLTLSDY